MPELPELDPVIHGKLRLAILSLLSGVEEADFSWLRTRTGSTDGNLGAHLLKLEEAGYVALTGYVAALRQLLGTVLDS
jgi:DNA-binding transcriptional ArsR family regulator